MDLDLSGTWSGAYFYPDNNPIAARKGTRVPFVAEIQGRPDGRFAGTVQDDESAGGHPAQGTLNGRFDGELIEFKKTMPDLMVAQADGRVVMVPNRPYTIEYSGRLNAESAFDGTWLIQVKHRFLLFVVAVARNVGGWEMRRVE